MREWELRLDPAEDGETNMAIDARLLSEIDASPEPRTVVRFYSWVRPTVSLGRNQRLDRAVNAEFCRANGLDVVYRPTGGRAVLHADEITYAVISNDLARFDRRSVYGTYRRISEALLLGYRRLGVDAVLAPDTRRVPKSAVDSPCFVSPSRYELMAAGRKIVGSAQRRLRHALLQHGSMPITCDHALLAGATRFEDPELLVAEMCGVAECLDRAPTAGEMVEAFIGAFEEYFDVGLTAGDQTRMTQMK